MPRGVYQTYDDEWILERWEQTHNWSVLCQEYNKAHDTDFKYSTFKSHCNRELNLNYHYSDEQNKWLIDHFPDLGRVKTAKAFNERFGTTKSPGAIKLHCNRNLGLFASEQRKKDRAIENTGRYYTIGTVKIMGNNGLCEKTLNGWERVADKVIGKAPRSHRIIHLDGNILNNDVENLVHLNYVQCALMTRYNFWSSDPLITKTGIRWCDLHETIRNQERGS